MRFRRTTIRELKGYAVVIFICSILVVVTFFYAHYSVESKFFLIYIAIGSFLLSLLVYLLALKREKQEHMDKEGLPRQTSKSRPQPKEAREE